jgi:hypothetical protein
MVGNDGGKYDIYVNNQTNEAFLIDKAKTGAIPIN